MAQSPGKDTETSRAVTLRGKAWSVELGRSGALSGAAMVVDLRAVHIWSIVQ